MMWGGLFNKNTGLCKLVRGRIQAEACPVPEGHVREFPPQGGLLSIEAPVNGSSNYNCSMVAKFLVA